MREIKFRAWLFGKHDNMTVTVPNMEYDIVIKDGAYAAVEGGWDIHGTYPTIPSMQFSFQYDENKNEIYVGDILSAKWKVEVYQNDEGTFMVKFHNNPEGNKPMTLKKYLLHRKKAGTADRDCIVIGNIYENPELLS